MTARILAFNSLRADPSRTATLREKFMRALRVRFSRLAAKIAQLVDKDDCFGLDHSRRMVTKLVGNTRFAFQTDADKVEGFHNWLTGEVDKGILNVPVGGGDVRKPWTLEYVGSAYKQGASRAYEQSKPLNVTETPDFYAGTRQQFLRDVFQQPEAVSKLQLLGTRSFEKLKGITADMSADISRVLANGLAAGKAPKDIARILVKEVEGMSKGRAMRLARTEIIHAHAEGQLDSFAKLGVEELGIEAEWSTAGDRRVCERCAGMSGAVYSVKDAHGLIPLHPNCRCAWKPYFARAKKKPKPPEQLPPVLKPPEFTPEVKVVVPPTTRKAEQVKGVTYSKEVDLNDPLSMWGDDIRRKIGKDGIKDEAHAREVGREVRNKMNELVKQDQAGYDFLRQQIRIDSDLARKDQDKLDALTVERDPKNAEYIDKVSMQLAKRRDAIRTRIKDLEAQEKLVKVKRYREVVGSIRDLADTKDADRHTFRGSQGKIQKEGQKVIKDAMLNYPKDWVKASANYSDLYVEVSPTRANYKPDKLSMQVPTKKGRGGKSQESIAHHEMFHRMEHAVPRIAQLEKELYRRRTQGLPAKQLGKGYESHEIAREDKFPTAYIGRDYGGGKFWEIGSMSIEGVLFNGIASADDELMEWILGVMVGV